MVKTIEPILGIPPMSLSDFIANDMGQSFQQTAGLTPYLDRRAQAIDL